jgi:hypothetical protein
LTSLKLHPSFLLAQVSFCLSSCLIILCWFVNIIFWL